jgi:2-methylcitrate dehydratase PrpD
MANGLGIAGSISPVQAHGAWFRHAPVSTIKYLLAGALAQSALTAAHMAELGHRGDRQILDDREFGYPRFIGTTRWEPERVTAGLGEEWLFPAEQSYKPYPHCRVMHALLDALTEVVEENDIRPAEIDGMKAWVEAFTYQPIWLNRTIEHVQDAQFSMAHGLAVGAHRVTPSKAWQDADLIFSKSVLDLMDKVEFEPHPGYAEAIAAHPAARPTRIEVAARGRVFVGERSFPKGSPSPDPDTTMTTDELITKFHVNAEGVLPASKIQSVIDSVLNLETVADVRSLMKDVAK